MLSDEVKYIKPKPKRWGRRPYILLHTQVPKPMHQMAPRTILGKKWWDETRQKAFADTDYHCRSCGIHKNMTPQRWLEGHEMFEVDYLKGKWTYIETVGLCNLCHSYIHLGRQQALLDKGEISRKRFEQVVKHGDRVLKEAGVNKISPYDGKIANWSDWRMVLFGKEYPPKFKDISEWAEFHGVEIPY